MTSCSKHRNYDLGVCKWNIAHADEHRIGDSLDILADWHILVLGRLENHCNIRLACASLDSHVAGAIEDGKNVE